MIPRVYYKTGPYESFADIPEAIAERIKLSAKNLNCNKVEFFNDEMCRSFIEDHFDKTLLKCYDKIIPTAYKADLWRYAVIYQNGGIYSDLATKIYTDLTDHFEDVDLALGIDGPAIPQLPVGLFSLQCAFFGASPRNAFLNFVLEEACEKIICNYYGRSPIDITGPTHFGNCFSSFFNYKTANKFGRFLYKSIYPDIEYKVNFFYKQQDHSYYYDENNNKIAEMKNEGYYDMVYSNSKSAHYHNLWYDNKVYMKDND